MTGETVLQVRCRCVAGVLQCDMCVVGVLQVCCRVPQCATGCLAASAQSGGKTVLQVCCKCVAGVLQGVSV